MKQNTFCQHARNFEAFSDFLEIILPMLFALSCGYFKLRRFSLILKHNKVRAHKFTFAFPREKPKLKFVVSPWSTDSGDFLSMLTSPLPRLAKDTGVCTESWPQGGCGVDSFGHAYVPLWWIRR
uniref:Uncharacterized protein n=1 Tax=Rousettus aegyptiacus TaxID=9407 RepID=A0A7J8DIC7_ROUAE|nr:hypothetical protein HJG63_008669 [Rousettus aegyptiacus]